MGCGLTLSIRGRREASARRRSECSRCGAVQSHSDRCQRHWERYCAIGWAAVQKARRPRRDTTKSEPARRADGSRGSHLGLVRLVRDGQALREISNGSGVWAREATFRLPAVVKLFGVLTRRWPQRARHLHSQIRGDRRKSWGRRCTGRSARSTSAARPR